MPTEASAKERVVIDGVPSTSTATLTGHLVVLAREGDSFSTVTRLLAKPRRVRPRAPSSAQGRGRGLKRRPIRRGAAQ